VVTLANTRHLKLAQELALSGLGDGVVLAKDELVLNVSVNRRGIHTSGPRLTAGAARQVLGTVTDIVVVVRSECVGREERGRGGVLILRCPRWAPWDIFGRQEGKVRTRSICGETLARYVRLPQQVEGGCGGWTSAEISLDMSLNPHG
jgi:hypothetical protein